MNKPAAIVCMLMAPRGRWISLCTRGKHPHILYPRNSWTNRAAFVAQQRKR